MMYDEKVFLSRDGASCEIYMYIEYIFCLDYFIWKYPEETSWVS
jgi:hypothetical protein